MLVPRRVKPKNRTSSWSNEHKTYTLPETNSSHLKLIPLEYDEVSLLGWDVFFGGGRLLLVSRSVNIGTHYSMDFSGSCKGW